MKQNQTELATFAGGCFWCMVKPFHLMEGVKSVISGYTGGQTENPTYKEVCQGTTGHTEAIQITFDPAIISYETLLEHYWQQIDPTDASGQFFDRGTSYRPAIFYHSEEQKRLAELSKQTLEQSHTFDKPIQVTIEAAKPFYPAEEYHQDYYLKEPEHYQRYFKGSGREAFIQQHWHNKDKSK